MTEQVYLWEDAIRAINRIHKDHSKSLLERSAALKEIKEHVDFLVSEVNRDIRLEILAKFAED